MNQENQDLLRLRASAMALEDAKETESSGFLEAILFGLASEMYAVESSFVREVYPLRDFTALPGVPAYILGLINVRGQIMPVMDLKKFFNLPERGLGELNKVIIIRNEVMEFGILADSVVGTRSLSPDTIQQAPSTVTGIGERYLKGVTGDHIIVLEVESILNDENIIINEEVK